MKQVLIFSALCALGVFAGPSAGAATSQVITGEWLARLNEEARTNQPALRAGQAQARAAAAGVGAVRFWESPVATVGGVMASKAKRMDDGDIILGVEQMLPLFGKASASRRVAESEQKQAEAAWAERFQVVRKDVAQAAVRLALADEELVLAQEDTAWLEALSGVAVQRNASGGATQSEVLRLRAELARRKDRLATLASERTAAAATLNRWTGRSSDLSWPPLALPEKAPRVTFSERLVDLAIKYEPRLKMLQQEVETAGRRIDLARRQRLPDVSLGLEGRQYSGSGEMREGALFVKFTLPWANRRRYAQEVERETARAEAAGHEVAALALQIREEVRRLTLRIENSRREAAVSREQVIPTAEQSLSAAMAGYQTGRESLANVMEARRLLLETSIMTVRAVAAQWEALSELVLCCGLADFDSLEMLEITPEPAK